jgi:serine/threonine protein kinase
MSLCINPRCTTPQNPTSNRFCQNCGSDLLLAGRYRVTRLLSDKGGFGNTYEVLEQSTPKVLKVLTSDHPHAIELFQQEAKVLQQLNHPGIPKGEGSFIYHPRDVQTPLHCLVMEKIEGQDLEDYMQGKKYQPISQELALDWLLQISEILHEVHRKKFFHRDIKPSNIILKPNGYLSLIDFGAVREITATILAGQKNTGIYTVGYASPEQARGYAVQQSDFYALGRTFVFLLTGKEPNHASIYDYKNNKLNWRKYAHRISDELADFLDELMAESVNERPPNTTAIIKRLTLIQQDLNPTKTVVVAPKKSEPPSTLSLPNEQGNLGEYGGFLIRVKAAFFDGLILLIIAGSLGGYIAYNFENIELLKNLRFNFNITQPLLTYWASGLTCLGTTFFGLVALGAKLYLHYKQSLAFSHQDFGLIATILLGMLIKWFYFTFCEFAFKGTFGKLICGLRVTNNQGKRISFGQANRRYFAKLISTVPLYLGFMFVGWTQRKRAIHDMIAGTVIIKKTK